MLVGVPKEIKDNEFRVGMTPAAIAELVHHGHSAIVEKGAGVGSGSPDEEYVRSGAELVDTPQQIFARADMIVKVKEPLAPGAQAFASGTNPVHLPPSRARSPADGGPHRLRRDLHRLRDRDRPARAPAALDADVGGGGPARASGRRAFAGKGAGRARRPARRRAGGRGRQRACSRRRRLRNPRRDDRGRHGRVRHRRRPVARGVAPPLGAIRLGFAHGLFDPRLDRRSGDEGRSCHWRGAAARRGGAEAHHARNAGDDASRAPLSSTSRSIRAAVARPRNRRRIRIRLTSSTASFTIASPTCPARLRAPRPSRSITRRCRSPSRSLTRAGARRLRTIRICARG